MPQVEPTTSVRRVYAQDRAQAQCCAYCGAPLDPFFYFCIRCATPYKSVASVVGEPAPMVLTDHDRLQKMAPHTWTVFWTYGIVVIVAAIFAILLGAKENLVLFYFLSTLAIFLTTVVFTVIHWRPLLGQFKNIGFLKWEAWAGLGVLVPLLILNYAYHSAIEQNMPETMPKLNEIPLAAGIFAFCIFPAVTEEIAFRGLVQYWLDISLESKKALLLGSAMFAGLHFSVISFPYLFLVGLLLALVRRRTGSLYPGMLIHFLHNLAVITLFRF